MWIEKFKSSRTSVTPQEGAGCLSTSTTQYNIEQAKKFVTVDRRVTIEGGCRVFFKHQTWFCSSNYPLRALRNVCARWILRNHQEVGFRDPGKPFLQPIFRFLRLSSLWTTQGKFEMSSIRLKHRRLGCDVKVASRSTENLLPGHLKA